MGPVRLELFLMKDSMWSSQILINAVLLYLFHCSTGQHIQGHVYTWWPSSPYLLQLLVLVLEAVEQRGAAADVLAVHDGRWILQQPLCAARGASQAGMV